MKKDNSSVVFFSIKMEWKAPIFTLPVEEHITQVHVRQIKRCFTREEFKHYTSFLLDPKIQKQEMLLMRIFTPEDLKSIVTQENFSYSEEQLRFLRFQHYSPVTFPLHVRENWSYLQWLEYVAENPKLGNKNTEWELMSDPRKFLRKTQALRVPERNVPLLGCIDTLHFRDDLSPQMKEYLLRNDRGMGSVTMLFQIAAENAILENNIGAVKVAAELGLLTDPAFLRLALKCKVPPTNNNDRFISFPNGGVYFNCLSLPADDVVIGILLDSYDEHNISVPITSERITRIRRTDLPLARL